MMKNKIGIIGAGDIGFNLAELLALQGHDTVIYNRYHAVDNKPSPYWLSKQGKVMDMNDSLQLSGCGEVILTHNLSDLENVKILVITAGAKRSSIDETREELAGKNAKIVAEFAPLIAKIPSMLTLIISNPVDFLTQYLIEQTVKICDSTKDEISKRIVGVSYIDTMRLKNLVKEFLFIHNKELKKPMVDGIALGEHGPTMVPLMSGVKINGKSLTEFASKEQIEEIAQQTILRGNDIIKLTGASSVMGPAHAVMHMIEQISSLSEVDLPCSVWDGKRAIGKMARFNGNKVKEIIQVELSDTEKKKLQASEAALDNQYNKIMTML